MNDSSNNTDLKSLEAKLDAEIAQLKRHNNNNLFVGFVLMAVIFGYFAFMSGKMKEAIEPDEVAAIAIDRVVDTLPRTRAALEETASEEVPALVDGLFDKILRESLPEFRSWIQSQILSTADQLVNGADDFFYELVQGHMKTHGETLRNAAAQLADDEGAAMFEDALYELLEASVKDSDMEVDLLGYGAVLEHVNEMLAYLAEDSAEFTPEEETTRELIATIRELANRVKQ
ncbi:hypothetical protein JXA32_03125 [Candidatus Sumerlaeota bacterium]|nr:hypothetical protein [Candidatus Sumerlaeota bacterium]